MEHKSNATGAHNELRSPDRLTHKHTHKRETQREGHKERDREREGGADLEEEESRCLGSMELGEGPLILRRLSGGAVEAPSASPGAQNQA